MRSAASRFIAELALWNIANVICIALPTALTFFVGKEILGWGPGYLSFYVTSAVLVTLTWGSWAALVWTKNRGIRGGMRATTVLPGILTMLAGGAGLWAGFGAWYMWAGLIGAGGGMIAAAIGLAKFFQPVRREPSTASYVFGLAVYPLATTAVSLGVAALWYSFVTSPTSGDWRDIVSIATLYTTVIATALISTVIPAIISSGLRKVAADYLPR